MPGVGPHDSVSAPIFTGAPRSAACESLIKNAKLNKIARSIKQCRNAFAYSFPFPALTLTLSLMGEGIPGEEFIEI
jgi:hypothetical protein